MNHKFTLIQYLRNKIRIKGDTHLQIAKNAKIIHCNISIRGENNKLIIEDTAILRYVTLEISGNNCIIQIGKKCTIGHNCYLSAKDGTSLILGNGCMLSRNAKIMTSDGHPIFRQNNIINQAENILIGEYVWIADNVTILKNVTVGAHSIVGINATLTKSIPNNTIAVGNPATVVKENITWNQ